jgi:hypothetical protein
MDRMAVVLLNTFKKYHHDQFAHASYLPTFCVPAVIGTASARRRHHPRPFTVNQCFTAADARDPSKLLGGLSNPGASDCQYTEKSYSGNTFRFAMQCGGAYALQSRGDVTFDAQTMNGVITAKANVAGTVTEFQNKLSARRIGNC